MRCWGGAGGRGRRAAEGHDVVCLDLQPRARLCKLLGICMRGRKPTRAGEGFTCVGVPSLLALVYVHEGCTRELMAISVLFGSPAGLFGSSTRASSRGVSLPNRVEGRKEGRRRIFPTGLFLFPAEFPNSGSVITGSADAGWHWRVEAGPDSGRESLRTLSSRRYEPPALLFLQLKERRKNSPVFLENASKPVRGSATSCTARIFAIVYS